jgi:hypothetical protein
MRGSGVSEMRQAATTLAAIFALVAPSPIAPIEADTYLIDFDDADEGPLDPTYGGDIVEFDQPLAIRAAPSRTGNSVSATFCIDDVGPCPQSVSFTAGRPLAAVNLWVAAEEPGSTVRLEAFDNAGELVDSDLVLADSEEFRRLSVRGRDIESLTVDAAEDSDIRVFVDDIELTVQVVTFSLDPGVIDVGEIALGTTRTEPITVTNDGNVDLSLDFDLESSVAVVSEGDCVAELVAGASCTFQVDLITDSPTTIDEVVTVSESGGFFDRAARITGLITPPAETTNAAPDTTAPPETTGPPGSTEAPTSTERVSTLPPPDPDDSSSGWGANLLALGVVAFVAAIAGRKWLLRPAPVVNPRVIDGGTSCESFGAGPMRLGFHIESNGPDISSRRKQAP